MANTSHIPSFTKTPQDQMVHEIASPLIAVRNGREESIDGTAFIVAPGYAITAFHVIQDYLARYDNLHGNLADELNTSFELLLFLTLNQGREVITLKALRIWRTAPLDIAVLAVGLPADKVDSHVWTVPVLKLTPPKIGDLVSVFGFAKSKFERKAEENTVYGYLHPTTATGEVIDIIDTRRDGRLPFPCFQTNARIDGGMSGGPVFDEVGNVCGIACSNMAPFEPDDEHVSYACTLWPLVGTKMNVGPPEVMGNRDSFLFYDLLTSGTIRACDLDRVSIRYNQDGRVTPHCQMPDE